MAKSDLERFLDTFDLPEITKAVSFIHSFIHLLHRQLQSIIQHLIETRVL